MNAIQKNKVRECSFCSSLEGKPRLIGRFIVELSEVDHNGEAMLACQACKEKHTTMEPGNLTITHSNALEHLSKLRDMGF